jgi:hypothetical protein
MINERAIVSIAIRIVGLVGMMKVIHHWGYQWHRHHTLFGNHLWELIFELLLMLVGVYMLIGAPLLLQAITPGKDDEKKDKDK